MGELSHRKWRDFRKAVLNHYPPVCHLCGEAIDMRLPGTNPQGPSVDHLTPRSKGGAVLDIANCRPAHMRCNAAKQDRQIPPRHSRDW